MTNLMADPPHRVNLPDPGMRHAGVGIAYGTAYDNIYVQEFLQELALS